MKPNDVYNTFYTFDNKFLQKKTLTLLLYYYITLRILKTIALQKRADVRTIPSEDVGYPALVSTQDENSTMNKCLAGFS